jgi:hypothetical protein
VGVLVDLASEIDLLVVFVAISTACRFLGGSKLRLAGFYLLNSMIYEK